MLIKIKNALFKVLYGLIIIYLLVFVPVLWGHHPMVVISGSMEPTLRVGSIIYYNDIEINDFQKNDILVFKTKNHNVSHRIVDIAGNGFVTKGDANSSNDSELVKNEQVLGKSTTWCISILGFYADFVYTHKYLLFFSIVILVVDLCNDVYKNHKRKVSDSNEEDM